MRASRLVPLLAAFAFATAGRAAGPPADAVLADLPFLAADGPASGGVRIDLAPPGGHPLVLLLDTGSPESFATPGAAPSLGISLRRSKDTPYRRSTRLGRDVEILIDTRRGDTQSSPGGEWAVLGNGFLSDYVLEIDFPARRVRFLDPKRFEVPASAEGAGEAVLPIRLANARPVVEIEVGGARVPAALSTGAPGSLLLPGGWSAGAGLRPDPAATAQLAPMPGAGKLEAAIAPRVRIGPFEQADVPVLVAERGAQGAGPRSEALAGVELLQRYVLRIDYPRRRLWIAEPAP